MSAIRNVSGELTYSMLDHFGAYSVGGVLVSSVNRSTAVDEFFRRALSKSGGFITVRDAHGVVAAQTDARLREILNRACMTLPDGAPIVWLGKFKGFPVKRVTGIDFMRDVLHDTRARQIRHFFYGGPKETTSCVAAKVAEILGDEAVAGWHAPPINPPGVIESRSVIEEIVAARPDVIWVSLSTPKQEYWMANHATYFPNSVLVGIGAAADFFSGTKQRAPLLVQKLGFEWLFRILQEPKRLGPRYRHVVPGMLKILFEETMRRPLRKRSND
jgi:N-acetylglucosaminyldiphosphoundecaprenol N-acetyl-beta-D-mannosaminyltransferase